MTQAIHTTNSSRDPSQRKTQRRVLITGGAGFIGSSIAMKLLQNMTLDHHADDVVILVDNMNDEYDQRIKYYNLSILTSVSSRSSLKTYNTDVLDLQSMQKIFEEEKPTHICHLITSPTSHHGNTNAIAGMSLLLDLAIAHGIQNFVYACPSSFPDSCFCDPHQSVTQFAFELLASARHESHGLNVAGLRFSNVYGPRARPDAMISKLIDRAIKGMPIQQPHVAQGESWCQDYIYISDAVDGVLQALARPLGCEVINLGSGETLSFHKLTEAIERAVGKKATIDHLSVQRAEVRTISFGVAKARLLLDHRPQVSFEDGIALTVEWYKLFYSVIFPGGNVGYPVLATPDSFAPVWKAPTPSSLPPPHALSPRIPSSDNDHILRSCLKKSLSLAPCLSCLTAHSCVSVRAGDGINHSDLFKIY